MTPSPVASVRTEAAPMAFTGKEFALGAFAAWATFMIVLVLALTVQGVADSGPPWGSPLSMIFLYLLYGVPIGGIVAALATLVLAPLAWGIGRMLRRERRPAVHIGAYLLLGACIGLAIVLIPSLVTGGDAADVRMWRFACLVAAACAVSVAAGWAWTARRIIPKRWTSR